MASSGMCSSADDGAGVPSYEPSLPPDAKPQWEAQAKAPVPRGLSAYIRPKRKVPALLRVPQTPTPVPVPAPADTAPV